MRKLISILLVLLFAVSVLALDFSECVRIIKQHYKEKEKDEAVLKVWRDGLKDKQYYVDHITIGFEFVRGSETTDGRLMVGGVVTTIGYCLTLEKFKVRVVQMVGVAIIMSEDKKSVDKSLVITNYQQTVVPRWDDTLEV